MPYRTRKKGPALLGFLWLPLFLKYGCTAMSLEPGFLDFDNLPDTNFTCVGKVIGGYYADLETSCQMFHVCTIGQLDEPMDIRFLCLNGTVFDQETRVCERIDEVDCSKSEQFYSLNLELYGNTQPPAVDDSEQPEDLDDDAEINDDGAHESNIGSNEYPNQSTTQATTTTTKQFKPKTTRQSFIITTARPPTTTSTTAAPPHTTQTVAPPLTHRHFPIRTHSSLNSGTFNPQEINNLDPVAATAASPLAAHKPPQNYHQQDIVLPPPKVLQHQQQQQQAFYSAVTMTTPKPKNVVSYDLKHHPQRLKQQLPVKVEMDASQDFHTESPPPLYPQHNYQYHSHVPNFRPSASADLFNRHKHFQPSATDYKITTSTSYRSIYNQPTIPTGSHHPIHIQSSYQPTLPTTITTYRTNPHGHGYQQQVAMLRPQAQPFYHNRQHYQHQQQQQQPLTSSYQRTDKPPRIQLPLPLIPTLPPITFSSPAPFSLSVHHQRRHHSVDDEPKQFLPAATTSHHLQSSPPRIVISASASVSDASGRKFNYSLGTIGDTQLFGQEAPSSYDDYKEEDVAYDPFFRDVPKLKRHKRSAPAGRQSRLTDKSDRGEDALDTLRFLFNWYNHNKNETVTESPTATTQFAHINIPVKAEDITEINDALTERGIEYLDDEFEGPTMQSSATSEIKKNSVQPLLFANSNRADKEIDEPNQSQSGEGDQGQQVVDTDEAPAPDTNQSYLLYDYVDDNYEPISYKEANPATVQPFNELGTTTVVEVKKEEVIQINITNNQHDIEEHTDSSGYQNVLHLLGITTKDHAGSITAGPSNATSTVEPELVHNTDAVIHENYSNPSTVQDDYHNTHSQIQSETTMQAIVEQPESESIATLLSTTPTQILDESGNDSDQTTAQDSYLDPITTSTTEIPTEYTIPNEDFISTTMKLNASNGGISDYLVTPPMDIHKYIADIESSTKSMADTTTMLFKPPQLTLPTVEPINTSTAVLTELHVHNTSTSSDTHILETTTATTTRAQLPPPQQQSHTKRYRSRGQSRFKDYERPSHRFGHTPRKPQRSKPTTTVVQVMHSVKHSTLVQTENLPKREMLTTTPVTITTTLDDNIGNTSVSEATTTSDSLNDAEDPPSTESSISKSAKPTAAKNVLRDPATTPLSQSGLANQMLGSTTIKTFNCFNRELNRFYSDPRDCRLFHYCTSGFTHTQLLDMKFVCDLGTYFDVDTLVCTKQKPVRCA